jgi:hypothetical protein
MTNDMRTRYERLAAQVERPESWRPEPGDTLVGAVVRWELAQPIERNNFSRACDICVVRDGEGHEHAVWLWHWKLRAELVGDPNRIPDGDTSTFTAQAGDFVAIRFQGKRPKTDGSGETVANYSIAIDKNEAPIESGPAESPLDSDIPFAPTVDGVA